MRRKTKHEDDEPRVVVIGTSRELNEWLIPVWALTCGFAAVRCDNLQRWIDRMCDGRSALGVIDTQVGGRDLFRVARRVRAEGVLTPILAVFDVEDSEAFATLPGSDVADAVKRPWDLGLVMARMSALLTHPWGTFTNQLRIGRVSFDLVGRELRVGERIVDLSPLESRLASCLFENAPRSVSLKELRRRAHRASVAETSVRKSISGFRDKLRRVGLKGAVKTLRREGYCLDLRNPAVKRGS